MTSDDIARMLDRLTDRVDRIENSGDEQEAEVATFFDAKDRGVATDETDAITPTEDRTETATAADEADAVGVAEGREETTVSADGRGDVAGTDVETLLWNNSSWNTATYE